MAKTNAQMLEEARGALHRLLTGQQEVELTYDGRTVKYTSANETKLRNYIRELEEKVGERRSARGSIPVRF
ncbi:MAG: gpW family head-tail joining protein [Pseudomonadota bacterium]|nr:gpW family head-tail joining protein [Pseudomonadota bacterium]